MTTNMVPLDRVMEFLHQQKVMAEAEAGYSKKGLRLLYSWMHTGRAQAFSQTMVWLQTTRWDVGVELEAPPLARTRPIRVRVILEEEDE